MKKFLTSLIVTCCSSPAILAAQATDHLVLEGADGPGKGKHVVLLAGDEEYRSEEAMPLMAQILASQGFKCTVLFSLNPDGTVNPEAGGNLSHSVSLDSADAIVMSLRFRHWDDESMTRFENAMKRGTPIVALRTSTHAFNFPKTSKWAKYSFDAAPTTGWDKGFGRQILGETWVSHHGQHKVQGTRTVIENAHKTHPVLNGVGEIFVTTDVYGANPIPENTAILLRGQVTQSLDPSSPAVQSGQNNPMQPVAWAREIDTFGKPQRILTSTMGAATDLTDPDLRRLVVNGVFWGLKLDVPKSANVDLPGAWNPSAYSFKQYLQGKKPADFLIQKEDATPKTAPTSLNIKKNARIIIDGAGMASRMMKFGHFETELHTRYPDAELYIRNLADEGNTPGFRPHPGRADQYAFPGAKELVRPEFQANSGPAGHFETPDQWLSRLKPDYILSFFGFNSAFSGEEDLPRFRKELTAYVHHIQSKKYNGVAAPQLVLVSPTAYEDLSAKIDVPNGKIENEHLKLYTETMREVAAENGVLFVDAFTPSLGWYEKSEQNFTGDGALLNDLGYKTLAPFLADSIFGKAQPVADKRRDAIHAAVQEKNYFWHNDFKMPNGVHVFGRRYNPFGPQNYPFELQKTREMTEIRDKNIWATAQGQMFDLAAADAKTSKLPAVPSNYKPNTPDGSAGYKYGEEALKHLSVPQGYKIELFADERMFKNLANPVQMSFDDKGRLWVACMPSYPHYRVGDPKPKDTISIFEDTDGDGKADKETTFADDLHLPIGFEITPEGVYVSQSDSLVLLKDTDGDDKYDVKEYIMSGFDDHDTHHAISAFCADPSGAIYMGEGVFLHSNVETAYGTVRGTNGGFMRYNPAKRHLERTAQLNIPNPWGIAFDDYGQNFFIHTSGPELNWMMPGTVKPTYARNINASRNLLANHLVRPTSGLEFVSSRHFPDDVQGDALINNNIGFLGTKQHKVERNGTGYKLSHRQDLLRSSDPNFRPVDLEFAPDGSLYLLDWSNALIGHMQHNARDPFRDHVHGRIYRITYPSRPLVKPAKVAGASIEELLENLKLPEYRTRYRTRRALRGQDPAVLLPAIAKWTAVLDKNDAKYEHHLLEALWVTWGINKIDNQLVEQLLKASDPRVRAATVRAIRYNTDKISNHADLLLAAAADDDSQVRLEAVTTASWLPKSVGESILNEAKKKPVDDWMTTAFNVTAAEFSKHKIEVVEADPELKKYTGDMLNTMKLGKEVYHREAHCATCHQADGKGLPESGFPPLTNSPWVSDKDNARLIKLSLKGLMGPIELHGKQWNGAMTPFEGLLNDKELAAVLTYVKNSYENQGGNVTEDEVKKIRAELKDRKNLFMADELLKLHPMKN